MVKEVFTAGDVSNICHVSRQTVNRWLNNGELKGFRPTKNAAWRITRNELMLFMKENDFPVEFIKDNKIKVLVVDDEKNMTSAIQRAFISEERFILDIANSGFSAGARLEAFKPDVVVLDIFLGDMDGREFFKYIKNNTNLDTIRVIGISGKIAPSEIKPMLDMGFDDFLQKPFNVEKLKEIIIESFEK